MSKLETGKLVLGSNKKGEPTWILKFVSKKGKDAEQVLASKFISKDLKNSMKNGEEQEVEFERLSGVPRNARLPGKSFLSTQSLSHTEEGNRKNPKHNTRQLPKPGPGRFHNPYNFIPAIPYKECTGLEQEPPCGHHAYVADRYSGRITIEIKAKTPLLLLDTRNPAYNNDHPTFNIHTLSGDGKGKPVLTPTALKGPLRTAFEAVTNSRMGVFNNPDPLGRRTSVYSGLAMIPARIATNGESIEFFLGSDSNGKWKNVSPKWKQDPNTKKWSWRINSNTMYAAWLPQYSKVKFWSDDISNRNTPLWRNRSKYWGTNEYPEHSDKVVCWIQKFSKQRFDYWRVVAISRDKESENFPKDEQQLIQHLNRDRQYNSNYSKPEFHKVNGFVCVTNQNAGNKHDERVFFIFFEYIYCGFGNITRTQYKICKLVRCFFISRI